MKTKFCHHICSLFGNCNRKTEQFTETKTPAQASVGQLMTSQVSFVSTSVPGSFLERREAVGFVYLFL
jgi:hypothetical protein